MAPSRWPSETTEDLFELLSDCPAFVGVDPAHLEQLARRAEIAYVPRGEAADARLPTRCLVVQRGALLVRDPAGATVDLVGEGEFCAMAAGQRLEPVEDSLVVALPDEAVDLAWSAPPSRLRERVARLPRSVVELETAAVATVMSRGLITVRPEDTCQSAARLMGRHKISSLVVVGAEEPGIVTDRDLSNRLVAVGGAPGDPVGGIATFPVRTIPADTPVFEALVEMLATGIHHLPVTDDGDLVGMVSAGDLLHLRTHSPLFLRKALDRAVSLPELRAVLDDVPAAVEALLAAGTTARDVGRVITTVRDRLVRRLLRLATRELGDPPAPYAWLVFGSQGRREQGLGGDQDTGLVYPDGLEEGARSWFDRLGSWMTDALERCGYPRCPGGVMASEPGWRGDLGEWQERFAGWIRTPTGTSLLGASIAFDLRAVVGDLDAEAVLWPVIATAAEQQVFLAHLAREALRHRVPLGFRGRFAVDRSGEHAGTFDVKAGALLPIVDLARLYTLERGGREVATHDRLLAAADAGRVSRDLSATLREGYEVAMRVRLDAQVAQRAEGLPASNRVDPGSLSPLVRSQLREAFKAVRAAQGSIEDRYQTGRLG